jgi:hypothetical protein
MAQLGFELVEDGLTKTSGNIANHTGDGTTDRILSILGSDDTLQ